MPSGTVITCPQCGQSTSKPTGAVNRARAIGAPVYCDRACSGIARRKNRTDAEKREAKAAYDAEYRKRDPEVLRARKAEYYRTHVDREKEREARRKRMPKHVEYCRRPEYKAKKSVYDQRYRAEKYYGPFADAGLMLLKLQEEISNRSTWLERQIAKGTLNKPLQRKRDYAKRSVTETVRSEPQECPMGHATGDPEGPASASRG